MAVLLQSVGGNKKIKFGVINYYTEFVNLRLRACC